MPDIQRKSIFSIPLAWLVIVVTVIGLMAVAMIMQSQDVSSIDKMTSIAVDATVTGIRSRGVSQDDGYATEYTYLVSYKDSDKVSHEDIPSVGRPRDEHRHATNDLVEVRYDPRSPDEACLIVGDEDLVERTRGKLVLVIIGIVACVGLGVFLKSFCRNRTTPTSL